jgi:DNA-binding transcriptional ArsR family regulator
LTLPKKKEAERIEYGQATLGLFREIKSAVETTTKKEGESCVLVTAIEKTAGKDPRTVRLHLKILEESGYGHFASGGKLFCAGGIDRKRPKGES